MKKNINLYIVFGTIPSLYAQINTFVDKTESYVWVRQTGFFQPGGISENVHHYQKLHNLDMNFLTDDCSDIVKKIKEILISNKDVKFTVYTDDVRVQLILKPLIIAGIYNRIDKYILLSEGSLTVTYLTSICDSYESEMRTKWKYLVDNIEQDINVDDKLVGVDKYAPWFACSHNTEYLMPYKELIENIINNSEHSFLKKIVLKEYNLDNLFLKLNETTQKNFIPSDFNYKFNKNKKHLIIIGTYNFGTPELTLSIYVNLIDNLLIDIKGKYVLFFKPHPLFPVIKDSKLEEYLLNNNIKILPAKMPLEVLLWRHSNIYISGFCSSINSLVKPEKTKSFFGDRIGFSKLIDAAGKFNAKIYQLELSQDIASGLLRNQENNYIAFDNLNRKNDELLNNINTLNKKIIHLEQQVENMKILSAELSQVKRKLSILYIPLKPIVFIRNKLVKRRSTPK